MKKIIAAVAATALFATSAMASVSFDSTTGTGFVGKGDIQFLYGWNNAQAQANAKSVSFSYAATDHYDVDCEWSNLDGRGVLHLHDVTNVRNVHISSSIASDPRKTGQYTGYNLTGLGTTDTNGTAPVVGGACPEAASTAVITGVTLTDTTGGLSVTYGGTTYDLPNTPVI